MRSLSWMTLVLFVAGCPTPPEEGPGSTPPGGPQPAGEPGAAPGAPGMGAPDGTPPAPGTGPAAVGLEGGTLLKVMGTPPKDAPKLTQDQLKAGEHVTISGTIQCDQCTEAMVLRVTEIPEPTQGEPTPPALITSLAIAVAGDFSVAVPKQDKGLVIELLADADGSGSPTEGERMVVLPLLDTLMPTEARTGVKLNLTDRPIVDAAPPGIPAQDPNAPAPGPAPEGGAPPAAPKAGEPAQGAPGAPAPAGG